MILPALLKWKLVKPSRFYWKVPLNVINTAQLNKLKLAFFFFKEWIITAFWLRCLTECKYCISWRFYSEGDRGSPWDRDFLGGSDGKVSACNAEDPGSIHGLGRSPGEGNGTPHQYSCLENPMDGGTCGLQSMGSQRVRQWLHFFFSGTELCPRSSYD